MSLPRPGLVVHADWSVNHNKRWMATAVARPAGGYAVVGVQPVGDLSAFLSDLTAESAHNAPVLVGFDFPLGLPLAYARRAGISSFLDFLVLTSQAPWENFFEVARLPHEISVRRPFYPHHPDQASQAHLLNALGMEHMDQLRRVCEHGRPGRPPACPLFWTLGGQQVGKAAISGWRDLLIPALKDRKTSPSAKVWPFSGSLSDLCREAD